MRVKDKSESNKLICECDHLPAFAAMDISRNMVRCSMYVHVIFLFAHENKASIVLRICLKSGLPWAIYHSFQRVVAELKAQLGLTFAAFSQ